MRTAAIAAQGYMQDVTARRRDSRRLELLVGILSLAANETPPDEIVAQQPRTSRRCSATSRSPTSSRATRAATGSATRPDKGKPEFWDEVEWSAEYVERHRARGRSSSRTSPGGVARAGPRPPPRARRRVLRGRAAAAQRRVSGVLWFNSSRPRKWGDNEVSVLVDVAGQLAIVLANAEAREQRQRAASATCAAATRSSRRSAVPPSCSSRRPTGATVRTGCSNASASPRA